MLTIIHSTSYFLLICFATLFTFLISFVFAFDSFKKKALYCFFQIVFAIYYIAITKCGCDNINIDLVYMTALCIPYAIFIVCSLLSVVIEIEGDVPDYESFVALFSTIFLSLVLALSFETIHSFRLHQAKAYLEQKLDEIQDGKVKISLLHNDIAYDTFKGISHGKIQLNVISKDGSVKLQGFDIITDIVPIKVIGRQNINKVSLSKKDNTHSKSEDDIMIVCHMRGNTGVDEESFDAIIPLNDYTQLVQTIRQANSETLNENNKKDSDQESLQRLLVK